MLPAPNLDDRRFQDLVDEAKRRIQQQCPAWTDHNVSDPGITMVELFAWMTDLVVYRLNRVPDRHYVKYLELLDVHLFPPVAARVPVTFWLSAPQDGDVELPAGTVVSTRRTEGVEAISFTSGADFTIRAATLAGAGVSEAGGPFQDRYAGLAVGSAFPAFQQAPAADDALYVGLSEAVPGCAVALRMSCEVEGVGVDPTDPPLVWEAQAGADWVPCDLERDETGGLNQSGDIVLHVPAGHSAGTQGSTRGGWLRCRVVEAGEHQPRYTESPRILGMEAFVVGGTVDCVHARIVHDELVALSEGVAGQRFPLAHRPVVLYDPEPVLQVRVGDDWSTWDRVDSFAESSADDPHYRLDPASGEVEFGPSVRQQDGSFVQFGAVPPQGAPIRMRTYGAGGGRAGNVAPRTISVLKTSIPFVHEVTNRRAAAGGVDGESLESAKQRGALQLRTRNRAVTAEDYELLTKEVAPEIARVKCLPAEEGLGARVLVVADAARDEEGQLRLEQLLPGPDTVARVVEHLEARRMVGARVLVQPATFQGVTVVATVQAAHRADRERVRLDCLAALNRYFDPIVGGPDGHGWPFGRPITVGDVYPVLGRVRGVHLVDEALLFGADPFSGERGEEASRIDISPSALAVSYRHTVRVRDAG